MKYLNPLLISFLQILVVVGLHDTFIWLWRMSGHSIRYNLGWGISVHFGLYLFSICVLVLNYAKTFGLSRKKQHAGLILFIIIFILLGLKDLGYTPYRTSLFICCIIAGFLSKYLWERIFS